MTRRPSALLLQCWLEGNLLSLQSPGTLPDSPPYVGLQQLLPLLLLDLDDSSASTSARRQTIVDVWWSTPFQYLKLVYYLA